MKSIIRLLFLSAFFILTSTTCDDDEYISISFKNNQDEPIYVIEDYCDGYHIMMPERVFSVKRTVINAHKYGNIEMVLKEPLESGEILQLFVFKESTLKQYTVEELQEKNYYDKRFFLTLDDLEACNYRLKYTDGADCESAMR